MTNFIQVLTAIGSKDDAQKIAASAVGKRLASIYNQTDAMHRILLSWARFGSDYHCVDDCDRYLSETEGCKSLKVEAGEESLV